MPWIHDYLKKRALLFLVRRCLGRIFKELKGDQLDDLKPTAEGFGVCFQLSNLQLNESVINEDILGGDGAGSSSSVGSRTGSSDRHRSNRGLRSRAAARPRGAAPAVASPPGAGYARRPAPPGGVPLRLVEGFVDSVKGTLTVSANGIRHLDVEGVHLLLDLLVENPPRRHGGAGNAERVSMASNGEDSAGNPYSGCSDTHWGKCTDDDDDYDDDDDDDDGDDGDGNTPLFSSMISGTIRRRDLESDMRSLRRGAAAMASVRRGSSGASCRNGEHGENTSVAMSDSDVFLSALSDLEEADDSEADSDHEVEPVDSGEGDGRWQSLVDEGLKVFEGSIRQLVQSVTATVRNVNITIRIPPPGCALVPHEPPPSGTLELLIHMAGDLDISEENPGCMPDDVFDPKAGATAPPITGEGGGSIELAKRLRFSSIWVALYPTEKKVRTINSEGVVEVAHLEWADVVACSRGSDEAKRCELLVRMVDSRRVGASTEARQPRSALAAAGPEELSLHVRLSIPELYLILRPTQVENLAYAVKVATSALEGHAGNPRAPQSHREQLRHLAAGESGVTSEGLPRLTFEASHISVALLIDDDGDSVKGAWQQLLQPDAARGPVVQCELSDPAVRTPADADAGLGPPSPIHELIEAAHYSARLSRVFVSIQAAGAPPSPSGGNGPSTADLFNAFGELEATCGIGAIEVWERCERGRTASWGCAATPPAHLPRETSRILGITGADLGGGVMRLYSISCTQRQTCPLSAAEARQHGLEAGHSPLSSDEVVAKDTHVVIAAALSILADVELPERVVHFVNQLCARLCTEGRPAAANLDYSRDGVNSVRYLKGFSKLSPMHPLGSPVDPSESEDGPRPAPPPPLHAYSPNNAKRVIPIPPLDDDHSVGAQRLNAGTSKHIAVCHTVTLCLAEIDVQLMYPLHASPDPDFYGPLTRRLFKILSQQWKSESPSPGDLPRKNSVSCTRASSVEHLRHFIPVAVQVYMKGLEVLVTADGTALISLDRADVGFIDNAAQTRTQLACVEFTTPPGVLGEGSKQWEGPGTRAPAITIRQALPHVAMRAVAANAPGVTKGESSDGAGGVAPPEEAPGGATMARESMQVTLSMYSVDVTLHQDEWLLLLLAAHSVSEHLFAASAMLHEQGAPSKAPAGSALSSRAGTATVDSLLNEAQPFAFFAQLNRDVAGSDYLSDSKCVGGDSGSAAPWAVGTTLAIQQVKAKLMLPRLSPSGQPIGEPLWWCIPAKETQAIEEGYLYHEFNVTLSQLSAHAKYAVHALDNVQKIVVEATVGSFSVTEALADPCRVASGRKWRPPSHRSEPKWGHVVPIVQSYAALFNRSHNVVDARRANSSAVQLRVMRDRFGEEHTEHFNVVLHLDRSCLHHRAAHDGDHWLAVLINFFSDIEAPLPRANDRTGPAEDDGDVEDDEAPHAEPDCDGARENRRGVVAGCASDEDGGVPLAISASVNITLLNSLVQYQCFGSTTKLVVLAPRVGLRIDGDQDKTVLLATLMKDVDVYVSPDFVQDLLEYDLKEGVSSQFGRTKCGVGSDLRYLGFALVGQLSSSAKHPAVPPAEGSNAIPLEHANLVVRLSDVPDKPVFIEVSHLRATLSFAPDSFLTFRQLCQHYSDGVDRHFLPSPYLMVASSGHRFASIQPTRENPGGVQVFPMVRNLPQRLQELMGSSLRASCSRGAVPETVPPEEPREGGAEETVTAPLMVPTVHSLDDFVIVNHSDYQLGPLKWEITSWSGEAPASGEQGKRSAADQLPSAGGPLGDAPASDARGIDITKLFFRSNHFSLFSEARQRTQPTSAALPRPLMGCPPIATEVFLSQCDASLYLFGGQDYHNDLPHFARSAGPRRNFGAKPTAAKASSLESDTESVEPTGDVPFDGLRLQPASVPSVTDSTLGARTPLLRSGHHRLRSECVVSHITGIRAQLDVFVPGKAKAMQLLLAIRDVEVLDQIEGSSVRTMLMCSLPQAMRDYDGHILELRWATLLPGGGGAQAYHVVGRPEEEIALKVQPLTVALHRRALDLLPNFLEAPEVKNEKSTLYFSKIHIHALPLTLYVCFEGRDLGSAASGDVYEIFNYLAPTVQKALVSIPAMLITECPVEAVFEKIINSLRSEILQFRGLFMLLCGVQPIHFASGVSAATAKLLFLPMAQLQRHQGLFTGLSRGIQRFLQTVAADALHAAADASHFAHSVANAAATSVGGPPASRLPLQRGVQPENMTVGLANALAAVTSSFHESSQMVAYCLGPDGQHVRLPLAATAIVDGLLRGLTEVLRGMRNTLSPEQYEWERKVFK